jgi:survival of motor neuron-related-splicing factor 30
MDQVVGVCAHVDVTLRIQKLAPGLSDPKMSAQDLETFQAQLEQVEQVLKADPSNPELTSLAEELKELISLTEQNLAAANPSKAASSANPTSAAAKSSFSTPVAASSAPANAGKPVWVAGDECLAKYSGDDKWYPARITSVGGSEEKRVYSVVFRGYNSTELVAPNALKRLSPSQMLHYNNTSSALPSSGTKRKLDAEEEAERERKKKKNEKKLVVRAAKAQEQDSKKASWQKFATKSVKKGVGIAGVAGTSIFKTPDNPLGKGEPHSSIIPHAYLFLTNIFHSWSNW